MKQKFKKQFAKRVFTRFHMILILLGTILSGVIFSKILLVLGIDHIIARFTIVLIFAYVCFFILMKLWLHYLTEPYRKSKIAENLVDAADAITSVPDFSPTGSAQNITGHGGEFGGGGASGIISEAAFELVLATTLIKKARSIDSPNWIGSVFRATWPAFALTMAITVIAGWVLMTYCPQANKIMDVFRYCI